MDAGYFRTIKWLIHVLQSFSLMVNSGIIINFDLTFINDGNYEVLHKTH